MDREIRKFDESYTIKGGITEEKKKEMIEVLKTNRFAYVR